MKNKFTKSKALSVILAFSLFASFLPMNLVQAADEMNYAEDEAKIKDYNEKKRYRSTQLEQGNGPATSFTNKASQEFIDGFRYQTVEPGSDSPDKTRWGIEIEFDKEKSQRTYTDFYFTNSGQLGGLLDSGSVSANDIGDNLSEENDFKDATYKASSEIEITSSRTQRNLNLFANEVDLEHINSTNNTNIIMAWQGWNKNYSLDNQRL